MCQGCASEWLARSGECPMCRAPLKEGDLGLVPPKMKPVPALDFSVVPSRPDEPTTTRQATRILPSPTSTDGSDDPSPSVSRRGPPAHSAVPPRGPAGAVPGVSPLAIRQRPTQPLRLLPSRGCGAAAIWKHPTKPAYLLPVVAPGPALAPSPFGISLPPRIPSDRPGGPLHLGPSGGSAAPQPPGLHFPVLLRQLRRLAPRGLPAGLPVVAPRVPEIGRAAACPHCCGAPPPPSASHRHAEGQCPRPPVRFPAGASPATPPPAAPSLGKEVSPRPRPRADAVGRQHADRLSWRLPWMLHRNHQSIIPPPSPAEGDSPPQPLLRLIIRWHRQHRATAVPLRISEGQPSGAGPQPLSSRRGTSRSGRGVEPLPSRSSCAEGPV
eukprot:TRINITY_DN6735_c0_g1_i1.p1 TRINITY_DN6735_c0_g1~~TRINITY_DN6735_c0_g1_i1.p1  ORF type:complete len:404 (-),score=-16.12 TRINITY_DN6735_c0_g1_i1:247-1392(-)